ncbi:hypothetical protein AMJ82_12275 [candidate division TA06 bacterium SM23_40]|uniref:Uncharacterized protein n=1 Tax=candidate division TA06 bacterium SM23_40 TaxID=1703774 RepID=A0A0S8FYF7_UNCT6|nr:MAG: hypothetical protein AMJ82_12275 [candidate division TA06 bacterium SM23_40]
MKNTARHWRRNSPCAEMEAFFSIFHPLLQIAIKQHASPSVPREVRREIDGEFIKEVATKSWSLIRPCLEMVIDERRKQR